MEEVVRKQGPQWGRKNGRAIGNAPGGRAEPEAPCHCIWHKGAADERTGNSGSTAGEGRHRPKPFVPEVGLEGTNCAVKLLTQEAETSLIRRRPRATKVTPRTIASNKSVVARIIPPKRLPCAWADLVERRRE